MGALTKLCSEKMQQIYCNLIVAQIKKYVLPNLIAASLTSNQTWENEKLTILGLKRRGVFQTLPNISDESFCKNSLLLKAFNYIRKKFYHWCSTWS